MSIDQLKDQIPDFAKDVRLNLASVMADETLSPQSKYGLLQASAIAIRNPIVTGAIEAAAGVVMTPAVVETAKSAASVMAMNNASLSLRSSRLQPRIQVNAGSAAHESARQSAPGQSRCRVLLAPAVSAINWWGACMEAMKTRPGNPVSGSDAIQTAVRLAAIVQSVAVAIEAAQRGAAQVTK